MLNSPQNFDIAVIGTASLDILHFAGQTAHTAGGAGLYTALAAHRAGAKVVLLAPKPVPMPEPLQPAADRLTWLGPEIDPADLPRLEIAHHGGGRATLVDAAWGAEPQLTPTSIPPQVETAAIIHIAALSTAQRQLDFLAALKQLPLAAGQKPPLISAGTYARLVYGDTERTRQLMTQADLFFVNENEATGLFGSIDRARCRSGARLFVTLGKAGIQVIEATQRTHIPAHPAREVDPTGAGDTFCGAALAGLGQGQTPTAAATAGAALAAKTIGAAGPAALLK
jgi:ribokinase